MIKRCLQALALVSPHSALALALGTAHIPASVPEKYQMWRAAAAQVLTGRGDADSLATAAALSFVGPATRPKTDSATLKSAAVELAAKASELDPENPSIGWLRLQLCANTPGCDVRDAATTMRWVDADNGAAWLPTLATAQKDKDSMEVDRILADMAQGVRFDLYWNRTVVLLFDTLKRAGSALPPKYLPSDSARLNEAMGVAGSEIIPPFAPLLNACRDSAGTERRESCLKLSRVMQRADTVVAQMAGFSIERRLSPPDSKEARSIAEHRRVLEWRVSAASQFDVPILPWLKSARARARIAQMRTMHREEDVDVAILREHRMPLEPPEDHR
ncbi:MAG: hypothetical protein ACLP2F_10245 [Steroidobacteraceae bacterium]